MSDEPTNHPEQADPADAFAYDVFISYSWKDQAWVRGLLLEHLETHGLRVCIDYRDFVGGAPIVTEMERAVLTSRCTLVVLTPDFVNSRWTKFEEILVFTVARGFEQRRLIPILKAPCTPPFRIQALTAIDFTDPTRHDFAYNRLLMAIDTSVPSAQHNSDVTARVLLDTPVRILPLMRDWWWSILGWAGTGITLMIVLSIVLMTMLVRFIPQPEPGTLKATSIPPKPGDFTIAVAQLNVLDAGGRIIDSRDPRWAIAQGLANDIYNDLKNKLHPFNEKTSLPQGGFHIPIWSPQETGPIARATSEEQARVVEELAHTNNIDVIIYGNLQIKPNGTSFMPAIYVSNQKVMDAEELAGHYEFGSTINIGADINGNGVANSELRTKILKRVHVLIQFMTGLGYFSLGKYIEAANVLNEIESTGAWDGNNGKEVLYLFLGTTANKRNKLDEAEKYYNQALGINPQYARALLGMGEVQYHKSRRNCQPREIDEDGLQKAKRLYESARNVPHPPRANIPTKIAFYVGRVYQCLSRAGKDHRADAEQEFMKVIDEFHTRGNERVRDLAAQSHGGLGYIYSIHLKEDQPADVTAKYRAALIEYQQAIAVSGRAEWQAYWYVSLTYVHLQLKECMMASTALATATQIYKTATQPHPTYDSWHSHVEGLIKSSC